MTTETFTTEPENYRPKDIAKYRHLSPNGKRALFLIHFGKRLEDKLWLGVGLGRYDRLDSDG